MSSRAELEKRRTLLQAKLTELYGVLNDKKLKLEELELEYDLMEEHEGKLLENIAFLKNEAQVVKLKEYRAALESLGMAQTQLANLSTGITMVRSECTTALRQSDVWINEIKSITSTIDSEARIYEFSNDKRRNQSSD